VHYINYSFSFVYSVVWVLVSLVEDQALLSGGDLKSVQAISQSAMDLLRDQSL
jgi:hypothetical protein